MIAQLSCRARDTVHVNNWLLSTNLYPALSEAQIRAITTHLIARFPTHAIAWRSVNTVAGEALLNAHRRLAWAALAKAINGIAVPLMRRYKV